MWSRFIDSVRGQTGYLTASISASEATEPQIPAMSQGATNEPLNYVANPKHKEPWQSGRRGSLCPREIDRELAQRLLNESEPIGEKRYAVHQGRPYCAQSDGAGGWHGYPIGWKEVPARLRRQWVNVEKRVLKRDIDRYWSGEGG